MKFLVLALCVAVATATPMYSRYGGYNMGDVYGGGYYPMFGVYDDYGIGGHGGYPNFGGYGMHGYGYGYPIYRPKWGKKRYYGY